MKFLLWLSICILSCSGAFGATYADTFYCGQTPDQTACKTADVTGDVIGTYANFDIDKISFNALGGDNFQVLIDVNYGGGTSLAAFTSGSLSLNIGDLLFNSGPLMWAIPLTGASGSGDANGGDLFAVNAFRTASDVLGNPSNVNYRPTSPVWANYGGASNIGSGSASAASLGGSEIRVTVDFTTTDATFLGELFSGAADLHFAAATCGNDIIDFRLSAPDEPTPEPMSMALMGGGLLALGLLGRRRLTSRK